MDHIVITIRPPGSDEALLQVSDAMQQVLDTIAIFEAAERSLGEPHDEAFDWRLERASTNSPFTVVARAEPHNPTVDISNHVGRVRGAVSRGLNELIRGDAAPRWMGPDEAKVIRGLFGRHHNGIGRTKIAFDDGSSIDIDPENARAAIRTLAAINAAIDVAAELTERVAFGEFEGVMVAAGRYRKRPAIQIRTELYGFVWCQLSEELVERFGSEHTMADIWEGKTLGVRGRLNYAKGGKLQVAEALEVREVRDAPPVDLDSILDPNFTSGMDPHEYLRRLHDGELG